MTLLRGIALPPASSVGGGILAQATGLPGDWQTGVEFATEACLAAGARKMQLIEEPHHHLVHEEPAFRIHHPG